MPFYAVGMKAHWAKAAGLLLTLLLGCGGRTLEEGSPGGGGSTSAGPPDPVACEAAGIRLCGGPCDPLGFEGCPGVGCTPVGDRVTGEALDVGVCWPDIPEWVNKSCFACDEGEVCVHDALGGLYCVPTEVCSALWALGATTACRYADKSSFQNLPIADLPYCVGGSDVCGGDCGGCFPNVHCVGRSATQSFGVCMSNSLLAPCTKQDPSTCSIGMCATFRVPEEDQAVADRFGGCVKKSVCASAQEAGIINCYSP